MDITCSDENQRIIVAPQNKQGQTVLKSVVNQLPVAVRPKGSRFVLSSDPAAVMKSIARGRAFEHTWPELQFLWPVHPFMEWMTDKIRLSFKRLEAPAIWLSSMTPDTFSYLITVLWPNRKGVTVFQRWYLVTGRRSGPPGSFEIRRFEDSELHPVLRSDKLPNQGHNTSDLLEIAQQRVPDAVDRAKAHALQDRTRFQDDLTRSLNQHLEDLRELEHRQQTYIEETFQPERGIAQVQFSRRQKELEKIRRRFEEFRLWIQTSMTMEAEPYIHVSAVLIAESSHGI